MIDLELVGLFGLISLVVTFLLQTTGIFEKRKTLFYTLNGIGAGFLAYYAVTIQSIYFAILESVWCIGAFAYLVSIFVNNYRNGLKE